MASPLILIANPGSASRKYALYKGSRRLAALHIEWVNGDLAGTLSYGGKQHSVALAFEALEQAAAHVASIFVSHGVIGSPSVDAIGLRIVAPGTHFMQHHRIDDVFTHKLHAARTLAPLHIDATLHELSSLRQQFATTPMVGVSDSAFHHTKRAEAWYYGLPLDLAERYDIRRFGYHGLSVESIVTQLTSAERLTPRTIVCHLGSGASVTAVAHAKSHDNTMGYSPLEGLVMSTRSGSVDYAATQALKAACELDDETISKILNQDSGLLGLGKSADIRQLVEREAQGNADAKTALDTYVYSVQKGIGQMTAAIGGLDVLVFTGTVGERSYIMRQRIVAELGYLDLHLDNVTNSATTQPESLTVISKIAHSKPILVIPTDESAQMAAHVAAFTRG